MISKIFSGHSFRPACRYICNKAGASVLTAEGVRGHHYDQMADDFIIQQQLHPAKKQACFHAVLSFYPGEGERLGNEKMLEIAKKYLDEIGIKNTQYAIAKHTDRAHIHLHIIANLVDGNGKVIGDSYIGLRGKKIAQKLTETYGLIPAKRKNLDLSHPEALNQSEANRYKIYKAILKNLQKCKNMEELETKLKRQGITTIYKYKGQTTEKQGISFLVGKDCFKGSKIDRKFSLGNLEKYFAFRQGQANKYASGYPSPVRISNSLIQKSDAETTKEVGKEITDLIAGVMRPEFGFTYSNEEYDNNPEMKKRKRKKKGVSR